jgi:carboxypeptidase family protein
MLMSRYVRVLIATCLLFAATAVSAQQNATVQGIVADESQAVMPGITVTATEVSTGAQLTAITEADGRYRFDNLVPGKYKLRFELSGFGTVELTDVELLVGQNATVPKITMKVAALEETVTVTSQAPLIDVTRAQVAGNIDRRQMAELPLQGRNWQELALMVKGITSNNITNTPGVSDDQYQLNLDGQQITQRVAGSGFGEPKLSREAIAEFQVVTNLYDITQGRSTGIQVQAVSRAGTNDIHGSTYGFFRSDAFNAADPVKGTVLPYEDQQAGFTLGGPIVKDKIHYFASYEYERNPLTAVLTPVTLPDESWQLPSNTVQKSYLFRGDYQQSPKDSFSVRYQRWTSANPFIITSGGTHPSMAESDNYYSNNTYGTWTHVVNNDLMFQVHFGVDLFDWFDDPIPSNNQQFYQAPFGVPVFQFPNGLSMGGQQNYPNYTWQTEYQYRADVNWHLGKHELKFGVEYMADRDTKVWDLNRRGTYVFNKLPSTAILEADFPESAWNNPSVWNIANLKPYLQEFDIFYNPDYLVNVPRPYTAAWIGDNWRATNNLTINLGVRYDLDLDGLNPPGVHDEPIMINDGFYPAGNYGYQTGVKALNDFGPRAGFAYNVGGGNSLVIRGGTGIYYNFPVSNVTYRQQFYNNSITAAFFPTTPGFSMTNPTGGVTLAQMQSGAVPLPAQQTTIIAPGYRDPFGWQSSIGFQKQLGPVMEFDVDYTDLEELHQVHSTDVNLFYDPVTGYNLDPTKFGRPNPAWAADEWLTSDGKTQTRLITSSFTRRFSHRFQAGATYTRTLSMKDNTTGFGYYANNQFDPLNDWAPSAGFQQNTFRTNGIVNLPLNFALAGSYFYGSGARYNATSGSVPFSKPGTNRLNIGAPITIPAAMLERWDGPAVIPTGSVWPRDALEGTPLHKVDLRLTSRITVISNVKVELLAEVFNVFNWKNYGSFNTTITSASFGQPIANSGNAYVPREGQLGVRVVF